jgi:hypothetical protein
MRPPPRRGRTVATIALAFAALMIVAIVAGAIRYRASDAGSPTTTAPTVAVTTSAPPPTTVAPPTTAPPKPKEHGHGHGGGGD